MREVVKSLLWRRAARSTTARLGARRAEVGAEPVLDALARTIKTCGDGRALGDAALARVRQIEDVRRRYENSPEEIEIIDYGAGPPDAERSEEEMSAGTAATITLGQACRASKPFFWSLFLFHLVRELKPKSMVELGTCLGMSAAYQSAAAELNLVRGEDSAKVVTLEGAPALAARSRSHLDELGLSVEVVVGPFQTTFQQVLERSAPIDLLFVDGHHDEQATVQYFRQALGFLAPSACVVFDDVAWSDGMRRAWSVLREDASVDSYDLGDLGVVVLRGPDPGISDPGVSGGGASAPARVQMPVPASLVRYARLN